MAVRDRHITNDQNVAKEIIPIRLVTAISQTGVVAFKYTPGFPFRITRVRTFNSAKAGAVAGVLKVATRTAVSTVSFTSATEVAQSLASSVADISGDADEAISLEYTTDGSGALTNGFVVVEIRPLTLKGDGR